MTENTRSAMARQAVNKAVNRSVESSGFLEDAVRLHPELAVELNQMMVEMHDLRVRMIEAADRIV